MGGHRLSAILSLAAAVVFATTSAAAGGGLAADAAQVGATLVAAVEQAYARREPAKLLALYAADATIVTRLNAQLDVAGLRGVLERDLATLGDSRVRVAVKEAAEKGAGVLVALSLQMEGKRTDGRPVARDEVHYYLFEKREEGWRIVRQSFRPDLGAERDPSGHPTVPGLQGATPPAEHP